MIHLRKLHSRIWSKQFLVFLFFLCLSSVFWLFQNLSETYESEFEIPVRLVNVPEKVVVTTPPQPFIRVTLKDHGSLLLQYRYITRFSPVNIDFSQYDGRSGYVRVLTREFLKQISQQLSASTRITSFRPDTLEYYYSFGSHRRIPVRLAGHITTSGQFRVSGIAVRPDSVDVYALPSVLDTISAAYTRDVVIKSLGRDTVFSQRLRTVRGAKFIPPAVKMRINVDQITEKTVQVPVQMVNFPATKVLRTFPDRVRITFQIGTSKYNTVNADNFVIVVSYDELLHNRGGKFTPRLKTVPPGISHVRIIPQEVEFIIEDIPRSSETQ